MTRVQPKPATETIDFLPVKSLDISHIQTEDETPVDNLFSERQQHLLIDSLYTSWKQTKPFLAMANVGLFHGVQLPPLVPDMLLSLETKASQGINIHQKKNRS
jgi:hypothetical protein